MKNHPPSESMWCAVCGYDRRASSPNAPCPECDGHDIVVNPKAHQRGLFDPGSKSRRSWAKSCLLLANLAAASIYVGLAIGEIEGFYGTRGVADYFNPFRFPGHLVTCVLFGGIGLAGLLAAIDRWAFRLKTLRVLLALSTCVGGLAWSHVMYLTLGPGYWWLPVSVHLIACAAVSTLVRPLAS